MSGPKISQAELERQRKAELERQRRIRLEQIKKATSRLTRTQERIKKTIHDIEHDMEYEISFCSDILSKEISEAKKEAIAVLTELIQIKRLPSEAREIEGLNELMIDDFNQIYGYTYLKRINKVRKAVVKESEEKAKDEKLKEAFHFSQLVKRTPVNVDVDVDFQFVKAAPELYSRLKASLEEAERLFNSESITNDDKRLVMDLRSDLVSVLDKGVDIDVQEAVIGESDLLISRVKHNIELFDRLYDTYTSEYVEYINLLNKSRRKKKLNIPKEKVFFKSMERLESEITSIRIRSRKLAEQNFIREQLDEVMRELGYRTSEELIFDSSTIGEHLICRSNNDKSALHIHVNENQSVMIEVVDCKTGPKKNVDEIRTDLTDEEKKFLFNEQNKFCELHPIICQKLKERGVVFTPIQYKKPDLKYCKTVMFNNGEEAIVDEFLNNSKYNTRVDNGTLYAALNSEGE